VEDEHTKHVSSEEEQSSDTRIQKDNKETMKEGEEDTNLLNLRTSPRVKLSLEHWLARISDKYNQILIAELPIESKVLLHLKFGVPFTLLPWLFPRHHPMRSSSLGDLDSHREGGGNIDPPPPSVGHAAAGGRLRDDMQLYQTALRQLHSDAAKYPDFERYCAVLREVEENVERGECGAVPAVRARDVLVRSAQDVQQLVRCVKEAIRSVVLKDNNF
jgi:hypothetical protein